MGWKLCDLSIFGLVWASHGLNWAGNNIVGLLKVWIGLEMMCLGYFWSTLGWKYDWAISGHLRLVMIELDECGWSASDNWAIFWSVGLEIT